MSYPRHLNNHEQYEQHHCKGLVWLLISRREKETVELKLSSHHHQHFDKGGPEDHVGRFVYIPCAGQLVEPETEGHEEQDQDGYELEKCLAYVQEHDDVNSEMWQFPDVPEKVEPGKNYGRGTNLVLPTL